MIGTKKKELSELSLTLFFKSPKCQLSSIKYMNKLISFVPSLSATVVNSILNEGNLLFSFPYSGDKTKCCIGLVVT